MEKPYLLHIFTPTKNASPFDVNMAYDAGWSAVTAYTNVEPEEITELVQDAIFSRGPKGAKLTGVFIGGRDMHQAMDMLQATEQSMVPPFVVSAFADPSGAFTTAAAMVAKVEQYLQQDHNATLDGQNVVILGGTGPVGNAAAVLAAKAGAHVTIVGRDAQRAQKGASLCNDRYGEGKTGIAGDSYDNEPELIRGADVVLATAKAGVEVLSADLLATAERLKVVSDVNAVPPAGIAGLDVQADGAELSAGSGTIKGIGALGVGGVKNHAQRELLKQMIDASEPAYLHFEHALEFARAHVKDS